MGNSQAKESRPGSSRGHGRASHSRNPSLTNADANETSNRDRSHNAMYASRNGRGSRPDLSFLGIGGIAERERDPALEPRRETKAEREARKLEKERVLRAQERERSIREEGVDGGYLVTLGTYTGPEDFSKATVRQLQIERRLAPFWKGLEDHSETWVEHQLVAVVNGKPLPPADEVPPEEPSHSTNLSTDWSPRGSSSNINNLTVPITGRSLSQQSDRSGSQPASSLPSPTSPITSSPAPFFRGRAKTLAGALTAGSRNNSQTEMASQEVQIPKDPHVNGQRIEAFLYKNASECPICFMYYPPYLNKTRCCDQPICSECFVQIKRPDPHPPEHHDPNNPEAAPAAEPQEEIQLVSEPAACPFCVQPEFGVTYEPPPFRRGLAYNNQTQNHLANAASAMSSSSSLNSQGVVAPGRRRATSLAANDRTVITTDRVRPDWAKKLADAKAHAQRRAAAATALHNAAYMMGNLESSGSRFTLGRRRRTIFASESANSSGNGTPRREGDSSSAAAPAGASSSRDEAQNDLIAGRQSSRRGNRLEDLEELMMMEAIRLSLAAEEERKKKEEKEAAKEAKKEEKRKAKDAKKAGRKSGFFPLSTSSSNLVADAEPQASSSSSAGKGKEIDRSGGSQGLLADSGSNHTEKSGGTSGPVSDTVSDPREDPQRHLEASRAQIQRETSNTSSATPFDPPSEHSSHRDALRSLSTASSSASSFAESYQNNASGVGLSRGESSPGTEPMFNFRSLEAVMTKDKKDEDTGAQHIEHADDGEQRTTPDISVEAPDSLDATEVQKQQAYANSAEAGPMDTSVSTLKPNQSQLATSNSNVSENDDIEAAPRVEVVSDNHAHELDTKHIGNLSMIGARQEHTQ